MKFANLSISRKVSLLTVLVPGVTIVLAATGWYVLQRTTTRRQAEMELNKLADLVALGVNDAVVSFQPSPADATRALEVLRTRSEIDEAHIFTEPDLVLFASTPAGRAPPPGLSVRDLGFHPADRGLWLVRELQDDRGRTFGRVALHSTLETIRLEQVRSLEWLGAVALVMFVVAYWTSLALSRSLSRPLIALADSMERIGESRDQSMRVPVSGHDEVGRLAARINRTLAALEEQSAALQASEERTRVLVASAPAAIVVIDAETLRYVEVNERACDLFGMGPEDLLRRGPVELSPLVQPGGRPSAVLAPALVERAMAGEQAHFEWVHLHSSGRAVYCDVGLVRLAEVGRRLLCAILVDVTERRQADERLRKSQTGLEEAQALARIGSFEREAGPGPGRGEWSREMFRLHGLDPSAATPTLDQLIELVHPEDQAKARRHYLEVLRGDRSDDLTYRTSQATGRVRHLRVRFVQVRDPAGQVTHVRGTCMDVTEQLEVEEQRRNLEAQLRQAQKLEALGTLAGGIAHDFNNILTAILGNVELARIDHEDAAAVSQCLEGIDRVGRRARDLVQRILAFSRQQDQTLTRINLQPVVDEVLKLLRSTLPANVVLDLQADGQIPPIMGDASQIHQVVMNLATNAWHALEQSPGSIVFDLRPVRVDSRLSQTSPDLRPGPYVRLDVRDTGVGMTAATMERIFEPFFTTKAPGRGTGLGLSVVHGIMKAHGGAVTVESVVGQGSTFHLYFPALEGMQSTVVPETGGRTTAVGAGQHILFIDDEEALVSVGSRMLQKLGYRVSGFTHASEALVAFQQAPGGFDLVVTDLSMPGLSGLEVAVNILRIRADIPVVLASGYLKDDEIRKARELGIREILIKPTLVDQLGPVLKRLLQ